MDRQSSTGKFGRYVRISPKSLRISKIHFTQIDFSLILAFWEPILYRIIELKTRVLLICLSGIFPYTVMKYAKRRTKMRRFAYPFLIRRLKVCFEVVYQIQWIPSCGPVMNRVEFPIHYVDIDPTALYKRFLCQWSCIHGIP